MAGREMLDGISRFGAFRLTLDRSRLIIGPMQVRVISMRRYTAGGTAQMSPESA